MKFIDKVPLTSSMWLFRWIKVDKYISVHRKWPEIVVSASTNQVWTKITIRSYAHVYCHSESDRSSVPCVIVLIDNYNQVCATSATSKSRNLFKMDEKPKKTNLTIIHTKSTKMAPKACYRFLILNPYTSHRTARISGLKSYVLKWPFLA